MGRTTSRQNRPLSTKSHGCKEKGSAEGRKEDFPSRDKAKGPEDRQKKREKDRREGREKGREEGCEKGREEGCEKGREEDCEKDCAEDRREDLEEGRPQIRPEDGSAEGGRETPRKDGSPALREAGGEEARGRNLANRLEEDRGQAGCGRPEAAAGAACEDDRLCGEPAQAAS